MNSKFKMNKVTVIQNGQRYKLELPNKTLVASFYTGTDKAFLADAKFLDYVTKLVAWRWHLI